MCSTVLPGFLDPPLDGPAGVAHDWTTCLHSCDNSNDDDDNYNNDDDNNDNNNNDNKYNHNNNNSNNSSSNNDAHDELGTCRTIQVIQAWKC